MRHILVIGGGASGVLLAVHLLREQTARLEVTILERQPTLGAGIAYATNHADHLLNVRASNMSAFPDDPSHFVRWIGKHQADGATADGPNSFVPRHLFRDYLASLLGPLLAGGRLRHVRTEALAVRTVPQGVEIENADRTRLRGDVVAIATGNEGPGLPTEPWRFEGWSDHRSDVVAVDAPVVVIGTGLTMVDRVLSLLHGGHAGSITAVSRRGLSPQAHKPGGTQHITADEVPFGDDLSRLARWMRRRARDAEAAGEDWRGFIDALRPHTQTLWQHLPHAERLRFLRHARPFWEVHRHRIAPIAARRLDQARARGQLRIMAAHIAGFDPRKSGVDVHIVRRHTSEHEIVHAEAVFECRGRSPDITKSANPVLIDMLRTGAAQPDALKLGLAVTNDCAVIDAKGHVSGRLCAIGPVTTGMFWEIVAIPDIRQQAQDLAVRLRARFGEGGPS